MKTLKLLLLASVFAFAASHAQTAKRELWMWKDANGVTHYSDVPAPGATRVTVASGIPTSAAESPPPVTSSRSESEGREREGPRPPAVVKYSVLEITSPTEGATYFQADAVVDVQASSQPGLASGDHLLFYLDGSQIGGSDGSYGRTLSGLQRGTHTVTAVIVNAQGQEQISSAPRTFNMRIDTVNNPRNLGPALRPKPPTPPKPPPPPPPKSSK
jgi:hypothetical protein